MALVSHALTTEAMVCSALGISVGSETALIEHLIAVASDLLERYCNRQFSRATVTEKVRGHGTDRILVSRTPVVELTSVVIDDIELDDCEIYGDGRAGLIYRPGGFESTAPYSSMTASTTRIVGQELRSITVEYVGGYVLPKDDAPGNARTLPYDIEQAAIDTAVQIYRNRGKQSNLQSATEAAEDVTWRGDMIPGPAKRALSSYRRRS